MNFDTWFHNQSKVIQIVLLILPLIGWIVDLLVRWSAFIKKNSAVNLVMALVITLFGEFWILTILDAIWIALNNKLFIEEYPNGKKKSSPLRDDFFVCIPRAIAARCEKTACPARSCTGTYIDKSPARL